MISTQIDCEDSQKNLTVKETGVYLAERKLRFGEYCIEPLELPDVSGRVQVLLLFIRYDTLHKRLTYH